MFHGFVLKYMKTSWTRHAQGGKAAERVVSLTMRLHPQHIIYLNAIEFGRQLNASSESNSVASNSDEKN